MSRGHYIEDKKSSSFFKNNEFIIAILVIVVLYRIVKWIQEKNKGRTSSSRSKSSQSFQTISNNYNTLDEVTESLRQAGLESSNLILAIDYTASNESQGRYTFGGKSLHSVSIDGMNPYQKVISVIGRTLSKFDEGTVLY
jgi:hypothetical protein